MFPTPISLVAFLVWYCCLTSMTAMANEGPLCVEPRPRLRKRDDCVGAIGLMRNSGSYLKAPVAFRFEKCIALLQRNWVREDGVVSLRPLRREGYPGYTFLFPNLVDEAAWQAHEILEKCYDPARSRKDRRLGVVYLVTPFPEADGQLHHLVALIATPLNMPRGVRTWELEVAPRLETVYTIIEPTTPLAALQAPSARPLRSTAIEAPNARPPGSPQAPPTLGPFAAMSAEALRMPDTASGIAHRLAPNSADKLKSDMPRSPRGGTQKRSVAATSS